MTVSECYAEFGGDYEEVISRLRSDERVAKFLKRVSEDGCMETLEKAVAAGDAQEAFRMAHTLKGICLNLSLKKLLASATDLTEMLRGKTDIPSEAKAQIDRVKSDYDLTIRAIAKL